MIPEPERPPDDADRPAGLDETLGRVMCRLGIHDFVVIDATFGFGDAGNVERLRCRRCGRVRTVRV